MRDIKIQLKALVALREEVEKTKSIEELNSVAQKVIQNANGCDKHTLNLLLTEIKGMADKNQDFDFYKSTMPLTITSIMISVSGMGLIEIERVLNS